MKTESVKSGQPLKISARAWNTTRQTVSAAIDARPVDGGKPLSNVMPPQNIVLVLNPTTEAFDVREIAVIDKPVVSPVDNEQDFIIHPNFEIKKPAGTETETPVILLEPANPDNSFTRAAIGGTGTVKIKVNSTADLYAKTSNGKTYLESSSSGQFKIIWKDAAVDASGLSWAFVSFQPPGGSGYDGYFKAVQYDSERIQIQSGMFKHGLYSGETQSAILVVSESGSIYLKVVSSGSGFQFSFIFSADTPANINGTTHIEICSFEFADSKIGNLKQKQYGVATAPSGLL